VMTCAMFFASPQNRTFIKPNCRMIARNGCFTFACARLGLLMPLPRALRASVCHPLDPAALGRDLRPQFLASHALVGTGIA
jgi:hypothetical protein